ncbi:MAG: ATP-binding protein [Acidimicrobiales bacterium]
MARWPARRDHRGITDTPDPSLATDEVHAPGGHGSLVPGTAPSPLAPPPAPTSPPTSAGGQGRPSAAGTWQRFPHSEHDWDRRPAAGHGRHGRHGRGPWRRNQDDRILAGVAGGLGRRYGIDATVVRIGFVIVTLAAGWGLPLYVGAWLLMPLDGRDESVGSRVVRDRQGIVLALGFLPPLIVAMALGAALHATVVTSVAWPLFLCCAGGVLLWRNSDQAEREWLRQAADPLFHVNSRSPRSWRRLGLRIAIAAVLLVVGVGWLVVRHSHPGALLSVEGAFSIAAAIVVLFGPWWLRLIRDLVAERQARQRAEDRADMAARVHDSVLQSLAMIQRAADDPQRVVQLARSQERELRAWLFDGDIPGAVGNKATTLVAGAQLVASEVEDRHGVPVEVVTVGDCPLDDRLRALLDASREATVNAAKWSGAPTISLFAEVERARVSVFVRDRGQGFDPDAVGRDHHGIAESIHARMLRHGGRADIRTTAGGGTEVELVMPRTAG